MVNPNDQVEFQTPVNGKSIGRVKNVDGEYVCIEVKIDDVVVEIERYKNEVKVLSF